MLRNDNVKVYAITFLHNGFNETNEMAKKYISFFHLLAKVIATCPAGFLFLEDFFFLWNCGALIQLKFSYTGFLLLLFIDQITTEKSTKLPASKYAIRKLCIKE